MYSFSLMLGGNKRSHLLKQKPPASSCRFVKYLWPFLTNRHQGVIKLTHMILGADYVKKELVL